jgi:hypothetical protein
MKQKEQNLAPDNEAFVADTVTVPARDSKAD